MQELTIAWAYDIMFRRTSHRASHVGVQGKLARGEAYLKVLNEMTTYRIHSLWGMIVSVLIMTVGV